ncbi:MULTISPECIES: N-acetylmuramic acid 6-phosphate etherase [unclassified Arsukibacterium]|uniref:N-acetylmuramic acid 6-phosphate etherase n=1 Tax=unclassified Arsukibacterium TaxID=2635278 RepID=UPI000C66E378|nr:MULTISPECIES: N-acetylmuramic acid 6-phosphate etherase [unclassified Arsukibacterium]MAA94312.1 N-acetylmuramic acid 6-phosphate etherase [Rheinheimera sp.]MBM34899.1 N-acetylmuramic acid 6-phosphate etherase [Rheinheimera sp.]HAW94583.1 N-acetylmuramic acid 6-phosphate etherase [Candidatus Azambacteria bacterium]|tara:strand:+ start:9859 stop:10779 length:921 start_codon:yes stop_codon:yes gene_type:complete
MSQSELLQQLAGMSTEARNPASAELDKLNSLAIVSLINQADQTIASAITPCLPQVARAVDAIVQAFSVGGRLIYVGAGTSGRLGILDAAECPPTFSVPANQVIGLIAGGSKAIQQAVEGAEDSPQLAVEELAAINFGPDDVLVGIAASGRTPYVLGALAYGRKLGATSVAISCNASGPILAAADIAICAEVGPEVLTGSTRMKAGTAQKMLLNMLSTAAMVRSGKVYQNLMVDLHASNQKLETRAVRIVMQATDCDSATANAALLQAGMSAKLAILLILTGQDLASCQQALADNNGFVSKALETAK